MWKADKPLPCLQKIAVFPAVFVWVFPEKDLRNFVEKKSTSGMCVKLCEFCGKRDNDVCLCKTVGRDVPDAPFCHGAMLYTAAHRS